ncbi:MAG: aminotransferase class I/II-fold pyridoxal phosphate-dependent enzyme [Bacillota bacterium]|nr:aminotransferase class I/II-fold pyridoxal phosphate-dependent enzyme [Bacillota bacterium]
MVNQLRRIYLSNPHMSGGEQKYIQHAFDSNWIAPLGPNVDAFEKELAEYVGIRGALALSSGTAAIHLALRLLGVGPGDLVFCSSLTFIASANPILYQGAEPVFIDSEHLSWNMSPEALKEAFLDTESQGRTPKAVIVVNLYGQSADMNRLLETCDHYGVPVIEDAAESLGAVYEDKASGTFGKFGIYSFNGNKIITTSGGGMLVSDDCNALEKARYWSTQARDPARHYQHSEVGYNYRLSNILAGIGRAQLNVLEERIKARRLVFERYKAALSHIDGIDFMPELSYGRSTRWLTALTVDPKVCGVSPGEIVGAMEKENIEARPVWKPMHLQPLFQSCRYYFHSKGESVSDKLFEKGLCLPSSSNLSEKEQERVITSLRKLFK